MPIRSTLESTQYSRLYDFNYHNDFQNCSAMSLPPVAFLRLPSQNKDIFKRLYTSLELTRGEWMFRINQDLWIVYNIL